MPASNYTNPQKAKTQAAAIRASSPKKKPYGGSNARGAAIGGAGG